MMFKPIQTVVSCLFIVLLTITHIQAFRLGRASMDNFVTRWWNGQTRDKSTAECSQSEVKTNDSWLDNLLD